VSAISRTNATNQIGLDLTLTPTLTRNLALPPRALLKSIFTTTHQTTISCLQPAISTPDPHFFSQGVRSPRLPLEFSSHLCDNLSNPCPSVSILTGRPKASRLTTVGNHEKIQYGDQSQDHSIPSSPSEGNLGAAFEADNHGADSEDRAPAPEAVNSRRRV